MIDRPHRHIETGTAGAGGHRQGEGNGKNERRLLYRSRPHCALHHDNCSFSCCRRDVVEPAAPFFGALTEMSSRLAQCGVALARGGSRRRGARHRRAARTRQSSGPDADAQASQEAGLRADCHRDGQVAIVCSGVRGARSGGLARAKPEAEQPGGRFAPAGPPTRTKGAAVQVSRICSALPRHACRRPQHVQCSTPSDLPPNSAPLPSR